MANGADPSQMEKLAVLLVLGEETRKLNSVREFAFFSTNETHRLLSYHTAYLWQWRELIGPYLVVQSGTAEIDIHTPANQWLLGRIHQIRDSAEDGTIHQINLIPEGELDIPQDIDIPDEIPKHMLWCPLFNRSKQINGGLVFFREEAFTDSEIKLLQWLIPTYQYTWVHLVKQTKLPSLHRLKEKPILYSLIATVLTIILFPVHLSAIGDGTVVPHSPVLVDASMQGVIQSFEVDPGQKVKAGQLLATFNKTDFQAAAEVNRKDYLLTLEKLRAATNQGFENNDARSDVPIIQAQLAIDKANLDYSNELLAKTNITSPIDGVVVFESKEDWVGQPVKTGERIMVVADPKKVELRVSLPIANSIELAVGNKGEFFLYGHLSPVSVKITTLGYNAKLLPSKILAYELIAQFDDPDNLPQLGAEGTVKLYGKFVPFIYYLVRRPLQAIRQTLGI
jgi:biotin carboxyl carrier protein